MNIRPHTPADQHALARLFAEMQEYYRVECPPPETILDTLASLPTGVEILVAEEEMIAGFLAFSSIYPGPGLKSGLFVKEPFVSAPLRRKGIGRQLMHAVARLAVRRGHARIDWTADRGNGTLLAFYEGLGAVAQPEKLFLRLTGSSLFSLAEQAPGIKDCGSADG